MIDMEIDERKLLSNPQVTIGILQKYHVNFQKKYGQNFLIDAHVLRKMIAAAQITKEDRVLEIGPGIGTLTQYLAAAACEVTAVEIDRNLIPILEDTLQGYENVTILQDDIMKVDLKRLVQVKGAGRPIKVAANLPYYITTPIIMRFLEEQVPFQNMTVMVQKEVAHRMSAKPGTKEYGALSVAVQYYAQPYLAANVPCNCFIPRPNVDSAVIRLSRNEKPPVEVRDEQLLFEIVRAVFNQRRKTLVNAVSNAQSLKIPKEEAGQALSKMGLSPTIRGETLSLAQFAELTNLLADAKTGDV